MYWISNVNGYFNPLFLHSPIDLQCHLTLWTARFPAEIQTGNLANTSQTHLPLCYFFWSKFFNIHIWLRNWPSYVSSAPYVCDLHKSLHLQFRYIHIFETYIQHLNTTCSKLSSPLNIAPRVIATCSQSFTDDIIKNRNSPYLLLSTLIIGFIALFALRRF